MPSTYPSRRSLRPAPRKRPLFPIGGGFLLPSDATVEVDDPEVPYLVKIGVTLEDGRYQCTSIECLRRTKTVPHGPPVTSKGLRQLPLQRLVATALTSQAEQLTHRSEFITEESDELLRVAAAYRFAYAIGLPPTKHVAEELGIPGSTATKKVMKAREAGLLGPTTPGKAGEEA